MGTTAQKLSAIISSKADIKTAIEAAGVTVGNAPLSDYGDKVRAITSKATTSQSYCVGRWPSWETNVPDATQVDGTALPLDWYPVLVDLTPVNGETTKRPVGILKRNNFLRFEDGSFAPTIGITAAQAAECDVALYLDDQQQTLYCAAGEFDAAAFYNQYGMTQALYDASGNAVRILRPWETTETKYSIFITRKEAVYLIDNETGANGEQLKGIVLDEGTVDGIKPTHKLVPTGIAPDACTEISGKLRCFFFNYATGETGCNGATPYNNLTGSGELFYGDGTYPRVWDVSEGNAGNKASNDGKGLNQAKNALKARACNYDTTKSYPVAEGGWHAWNTFITCLELGYGTKKINTAAMFGRGVSGVNACTDEATWLSYGGMRYKTQSASSWSYVAFSANPAIYYNASQGRTTASNTINRDSAMMFCMEAQMALSMAAELNVAAGTPFQFYGKTYSYENVDNATTLLNGRMNARLYRTRAMTLNAYNNSKVATTYDIEIRLLGSIAEGVNICGDLYVYMGGGHENIDQYINSWHVVKSYLECDQTKWKAVNHTANQTSDFNFQSDYEFLGTLNIMNGGYAQLRQKYGSWKICHNVNINTGECLYQWQASLGTGANQRYRAGTRVRGAHTAQASPRGAMSSQLVAYCNFNQSASMQVLMDMSEEE